MLKKSEELSPVQYLEENEAAELDTNAQSAAWESNSNLESIIRILSKAPRNRHSFEINELEEATQSITFFENYIREGKSDIQRACCQHMHLEKFAEKSIIFTQGEPGDEFYIILTGGVSLYTTLKNESSQNRNVQRKKFTRILADGDSPESSSLHSRKVSHSEINLAVSNEIVNPQLDDSEFNHKEYVLQEALKDKLKVKQLRAGEAFGELALITTERRNATVVTDETSIMAVLNKESFDLILKNDQFELFMKEMERFANVPLFKGWNFNLLKQVYLNSFRLKLRQFDYVYEQGDKPGAFYLILSGELKVRKSVVKMKGDQISQYIDCCLSRHLHTREPKHTSIEIAILNSLDFFGEEELLQQKAQREFSVQCAGMAAEILMINKNDFSSLILDDDYSRTYVYKTLIERKQRYDYCLLAKQAKIETYANYLYQNKSRGDNRHLKEVAKELNIPIELAVSTLTDESSVQNNAERIEQAKESKIEILKIKEEEFMNRRFNEMHMTGNLSSKQKPSAYLERTQRYNTSKMTAEELRETIRSFNFKDGEKEEKLLEENEENVTARLDIQSTIEDTLRSSFTESWRRFNAKRREKLLDCKQGEIFKNIVANMTCTEFSLFKDVQKNAWKKELDLESEKLNSLTRDIFNEEARKCMLRSNYVWQSQIMQQQQAESARQLSGTALDHEANARRTFSEFAFARALEEAQNPVNQCEIQEDTFNEGNGFEFSATNKQLSESIHTENGDAYSNGMHNDDDQDDDHDAMELEYNNIEDNFEKNTTLRIASEESLLKNAEKERRVLEGKALREIRSVSVLGETANAPEKHKQLRQINPITRAI